jgi:Tat protein translocase TatB subunit
MHFGDGIVIFVIALILFGPKKLPEIARQIAKLMAEFRRASNEFKTQIDEELRVVEQTERQKAISAPAVAAGTGLGDGGRAGIAAEPAILPPSVGVPVSQYAYSDVERGGGTDIIEADVAAEGGAGAGAVTSGVVASDEPRPAAPYGDFFKESNPTFGAPYAAESAADGDASSANGAVTSPGAAADDSAFVEGTAAENAQASIHHV